MTQPLQLELPIHLACQNTRFSFVDLFAGIGGFRIALERLGGQCRGYSEIDRDAIAVYQSNFIHYLNCDEPNLGSITEIDALPSNLDILTGGVPCQPWSVAGKLKGFDDPRGKLWFDVLRLTQNSQPKSFIFENVRGLASPKNRQNFEFLLKKFEDLGYCIKWKILNAYDFGLPQNRERVFIVGIRNDLPNCREYQFPEPLDTSPKVLDILDEFPERSLPKKVKVNPDIIFQNKIIPPARTRFQKDDELNDFFIFSDLRNGHTTIHSWDIIETSPKEKQICLALLKNRRRKKYGQKDGNPLSFQNLQEFVSDLEKADLDGLVAKKIFRQTEDGKYEFVNSKNISGIYGIYRIVMPNSDVVPTLTATGTKNFYATQFIEAKNPDEYKSKFLNIIYKKHQYKSFSPKHFSRLQGFPDDFVFHKNPQKAGKQFGNAVPVPVVFHVAKELLHLIL